MEWLEQERRVPVQTETDVLVAGGGIAGVAAALSAARLGANVCLAEAQSALGGLATLGMVLIYLPLCDGKGKQVIGGIAEELFRAAYRYGPDRFPYTWPGSGRLEAPYEAAPMMLALEELLLDAGVRILYGTRICDVRRREDALEGVITESSAGRQGIAASMFVDATGDAVLCRLAGENTVCAETRTVSAWFQEQQKDGLQLMTHAGGESEEPLFPDDPSAMLLRERAFVRKWAAQRLKDGNFPALIGLVPQFRKTYRLENGFLLCANDAGTPFDDAIGQTGDWRRAGPVWDLPYRMLKAVHTRNLLAAGRCASVHPDLWEVTRVIPPCAVMGQAAGAACALAVKEGQDVRSLSPVLLRETLKAQGTLIPDRDAGQR